VACGAVARQRPRNNYTTGMALQTGLYVLPHKLSGTAYRHTSPLGAVPQDIGETCGSCMHLLVTQPEITLRLPTLGDRQESRDRYLGQVVHQLLMILNFPFGHHSFAVVTAEERLQRFRNRRNTVHNTPYIFRSVCRCMRRRADACVAVQGEDFENLLLP
jgi:hypothetical protein